VLREREEFELEALAPKGEAWERRNRAAFLEGYFGTEGIGALLPPSQDDVLTALTAWELDKAVYEVAYERDHRPDWVDIPTSAIARLVPG
jgi:predicted trehalose synthase